MIYIMFKKCKENQCLNRQMLDFFARQFSLLKQAARTTSTTQPEIISDQIRQSVELMEKRIIFVLDEKPTEEFHDYVSDFYEDKLQKLRKELGKEMGKCKQAQGKVDDLMRQLRSKEELLSRGKPMDFAAVSENVALRNQLIHSHQLIQNNQVLIDEQNMALELLQAQVVKLEDQEAQLRGKVDLKVKDLNQAITAKHKAITALTKEFQKENKKIEKEFREVQLKNVSLLEEKDRLQSELLIKSQEIKLLSKKIYDQSLVIAKFQRAIDQSEGVLLEEKIQNNRAIDQNKLLREKIRELEEQYQTRLSQKSREIKELQSRLMTFTSSNKEMELTYTKHMVNTEKITQELKSKDGAIKILDEEIASHEEKYKEIQRECRRLDRKEKENTIRIQEYCQIINEKDEELQKNKQALQRFRKDHQNSTRLMEREKSIIKGDIEAQFQRLVEINQQVLTSLQSKEKQLANLSTNYEQALIKIKEMNQQMNSLSQSFQDAKLKICKVQENRKDLEYIREQLEIKLKHTQRKCEQFQRVQEERESLSKKNIELEETYQHSRKLLKEKQNEIQKFKRMAQDESNRKGINDQQQIKQLKQQIKQLREEVGRKDFKIRQMGVKIKQLQEELRDTNRNSQIEKQNMSNKIKQLQMIINQQSDRTHKMDLSIS